MTIQNLFPVELTDSVSLQSKGLSRVFSSTIQKHHLLVLSLLYGPALMYFPVVHDYGENHSFDYMDLCWQSKHLLISWLQSPSAEILEPKKIKSVIASTFLPSICHEMMGRDAIILVF